MFVVLFCMFVSCSAYSVCVCFFFCILCIVSPFVYSGLFPIFVQVCRPLSPGGNPVAVNKCYHIYHMSHRSNAVLFTKVK
jgi:hypothetical protein